MQSFLHYSKTNAANIDSKPQSNRRLMYVLMLLLPFFAILAQAPFVSVQGQISLTRVAPEEICAIADPTPGVILFTAFGITAPNVFTAQLSDATGSFANPTDIGTSTRTTGPAIQIDIPGSLAAGNYLIRIISSNQPTFVSNTLPFVINPPSDDPPIIEVSTKGNVSGCDNGELGFFTLRVFPREGGAATGPRPFTFTLAPAVPGSQTSEPSAPFKFSNLPQNTYGIIMNDGDGCVSNVIRPIVIGKDAALVVNLSGYGNPTTCGGNNGDITVRNTGGSGNTYRYSISKDGGAFSTPQSGRRFTGLGAGTYTIEGMDSRGCTATVVKTLSDGCPAIAGSTDNLNVAAKNSLKLQVLPNPTRTSFTLNLQSSSTEKVQIIVTDMFGKKLYQTTGSSKQQYTFGREFKSGMYIVQVLQGKQIQTLKLVKGN